MWHGICYKIRTASRSRGCNIDLYIINKETHYLDTFLVSNKTNRCTSVSVHIGVVWSKWRPEKAIYFTYKCYYASEEAGFEYWISIISTMQIRNQYIYASKIRFINTENQWRFHWCLFIRSILMIMFRRWTLAEHTRDQWKLMREAQRQHFSDSQTIDITT